MSRNSRLVERRNEQIVARYYYWTEVERLRFDDAIRQLAENEFFLSENVIIKILKASSGKKFTETERPKCPRLTDEQLRMFKNSQE